MIRRTMPGRHAALENLQTARQQFFGLRQVPEKLVSGIILRSWMRSTQLGHTDARANPAVAPVEEAALRAQYEKHEQFRRLCRPGLLWLRREARAARGIAILTDPDGLVLDAEGSTDFAGQAAGVALRPGVAWSEASIGTNAIGTALAERRAVAVHGGEHYYEPHRILRCAAAPVLDPMGAILGAIDLSTHASVEGHHTLALVRLIADQIEHRQFDPGMAHDSMAHDSAASFEDCDILRFHTDVAMLGTAQECILVFREGRLVAANRYGLRGIASDWDSIGQLRFGDLFDGAPTRHVADRAVPLTLHNGRQAHARWDAPARKNVPLATRSPSPNRPLDRSPAALRQEREQTEHLQTGQVQTGQARIAHDAERIPWPAPVFDTDTQASIRKAARLLEADVPLLITGETGVGKEAFARAAHGHSALAHRPFVAVNCAALPESLIESELFGYEDGAFTGARRQGARGLLREADGGVLFLDEIGDMPLALQSRLLRVLQERQVTPVGAQRPIPIDIRVMCATHRDIRLLTAQGEFRADLFYRLAQFSIALKPLRERSDRADLIGTLWQRLSQNAALLPQEMVQRLAAHDWPGNYRELVGTLRAMAVLGAGEESLMDDPAMAATAFTPALLPFAARDEAREASALPLPPAPEEPQARPAAKLGQSMHAMMRAAVEACGGNLSAAARQLGINRSTLYRHLPHLETAPSKPRPPKKR